MFTDIVLSQWHKSSTPAKAKGKTTINGSQLSIADVVEVARHLGQVELTSSSIDAIEKCSKIIPDKIAEGEIIYGVNTGFGGSADARSHNVDWVQQSLISHLTCGIVADGKHEAILPNKQSNGHTNGHTNGHSNGHTNGHTNGNTTSVPKALPLNDPLSATCMPEAWSRASMLIRLNSLAGGASGIRVDIADSLVSLLNKDIVPRIPVRGSISASGDLSSLAWIGAVMQGRTAATAFAGPRDVEVRGRRPGPTSPCPRPASSLSACRPRRVSPLSTGPPCQLVWRPSPRTSASTSQPCRRC